MTDPLGLTIRNSLFQNNSHFSLGFGNGGTSTCVSILGGTSASRGVQIIGSTFLGNSVAQLGTTGGAVYFDLPLSAFTIDSCVFVGNSVFGDGGAFYVMNAASISVLSSLFTGNVARMDTTADGGVAEIFSNNLLNMVIFISGCTFRNNSGIHSGGVFSCGFGGLNVTLQLIDSYFLSNTKERGTIAGVLGGGAVGGTANCNVLVRNSFFCNNLDKNVSDDFVSDVSPSVSYFPGGSVAAGSSWTPPGSSGILEVRSPCNADLVTPADSLLQRSVGAKTVIAGGVLMAGISIVGNVDVSGTVVVNGTGPVLILSGVLTIAPRTVLQLNESVMVGATIAAYQGVLGTFDSVLTPTQCVALINYGATLATVTSISCPSSFWSVGVIVGVAVGAVVFGVLIIFIMMFVHRSVTKARVQHTNSDIRFRQVQDFETQYKRMNY